MSFASTTSKSKNGTQKKSRFLDDSSEEELPRRATGRTNQGRKGAIFFDDSSEDERPFKKKKR